MPPGFALHGNPLYAGPHAVACSSPSSARSRSAAVKGALEEYESILRTRKTQRPPIIERVAGPRLPALVWAARSRASRPREALIVGVAERWAERCAGVGPSTAACSRARTTCALNAIAREALTLAWTAMHEDIFRTAGTSAARAGERMERIFRDVAMDWGHIGNAIRDWAWRELARERLGLAAGAGAQARPGASMSVDAEATMRMARADPLGAWSAVGPRLAPARRARPARLGRAGGRARGRRGARGRAVRRGAATTPTSSAVSGPSARTPAWRRSWRVSGASGLELRRDRPRVDALLVERDRARAADRASEELDALARAALSLLSDPRRPADERLDRALARERLGPQRLASWTFPMPSRGSPRCSRASSPNAQSRSSVLRWLLPIDMSR